VPLFLNLHELGTNIAGIFWGLWLFPMGYLVYKSGFLPRILGVGRCHGDAVACFAIRRSDPRISSLHPKRIAVEIANTVIGFRRCGRGSTMREILPDRAITG